MTSLTFLGNSLDVNKEYELFNNDVEHPHGFKAVITYMDGRVETRNNLTEVHHLFDLKSGLIEQDIAFESDLHMTGGTKNVKVIDTVVITVAEKMEENY